MSLTHKIRRNFKVDGVLTDPDTSYTLTDPTGVFGIWNETDDEEAVAVGTVMTQESEGVYYYSFAAEYDHAYTAWVQFVHDGNTYRHEHDLAAVSESTGGLFIRRTDLYEDIADYLGMTRTSGNWDTPKLDALAKSGARQLYWPPPLNGDRAAHPWTFIRPATTLATVIDQEDYDLPSGFGSLVGKMYYAVADNVWWPIERVGMGMILDMRSRNISNGPPKYAAVVPQTSDGTSAQAWTLAVSPAADAVYTLQYQYEITPDSLDATHTYHLGSAIHSETLLASCLAIAERRIRDIQRGPQYEYWLERLAASISHDRRNGPRNLGYMGDRSGTQKVPFERNNYVTYEGTLYD